MQNFRRLHVWERAHQFALDVRIATESFPRTGYSELKAQLVSAAESIPTNIVEGCGASSRKEFARYLDISIKSTLEVEYQLQSGEGLLHPAPEQVGIPFERGSPDSEDAVWPTQVGADSGPQPRVEERTIPRRETEKSHD